MPKTIKVSKNKVQQNLEKLVEACKPNTDNRNGLPIGYRPSRDKLIAKLCVYMELSLLTEHDYDYYYWRLIDEYKKYEVTSNAV